MKNSSQVLIFFKNDNCSKAFISHIILRLWFSSCQVDGNGMLFYACLCYLIHLNVFGY